MKYRTLLILLILTAICLGQRRYYHETGTAILRVDETYPGAIVEHRFVETAADNLFRAFLALGDGSEKIAYGSAHEYAPLSEGTFTLYEPVDPADPDTFQIYEFYDTLVSSIDTIVYDTLSGEVTEADTTWLINLVQSETRLFFEDTDFGVLVEQHITAVYDTTGKIYADYIFENISSVTISDIKVVLFYDGDVPDWGYRDDSPFSVGYLNAIGIQDDSESDGVCSGFCAIRPDTLMQIGTWLEWVDTTHTSDTTNIRALLTDEPYWPPDSETVTPGDWSVYGMWDYDDLAPGGIDTLRIAYIVSDSSSYDTLAASARGDSVISRIDEFYASQPARHSLYIAPNPFNATCRILLPEIPGADLDLRIFDITGKIVKSEKIGSGVREIRWDGRDESGNPMPSGVYLFRLSTEQKTVANARAIFLK